ncbi:tripartite motif-containing protein 16-like [Lepisosteus oculatus]|uniref:tripartite motif-containing protein 16-like n=1 Tax=Lepisosteus oculatus TaxID=7918 RepID=UPI003710B6F5
MAEPSTSTAQTCLACTVCLETLKDPVTLPCGHHFCMGCIKSCWDRDNPDRVYKCPQCRKDFPKRPILHRNTVLAAAVDKLRSGMKRPYPSESTAGPGDVLCDVCTGSQVRAVKSCLVCLASYCQTHLQPHCEAPAFKRHRLVEATGQLQDKICPDHQKLREVYCRTDQTCVCLLCSETRHRGHDTVSTEREWTEKQRQLQEIRTQTQRKIQEREKELQELRQAGESFKRSAQKSLLETDRILKNMILSFEKMRSKIKEQFELKKTAIEKKGVSLTKRLEQEIAELRRRDAELSQLSHTEDHIHFLQNFQSVSVPPGAGDSPSITVDSNFSFEAVRRAVSGLKERLEDIWNGESIKIMQKVKDISIVQAAEPRTRAEFLQYACQLTLDPNTAHRHLRLSEGNRRATWNEKTQPYPNHPGRFDCYYQVLCREGLSDRRC